MTNNLLKRIISSILILPLVLFVVFKGSFYFIFFLFFCLVISIYEWFNISKKNNYLYPGILFLFFSFYTIYELRFNLSNDYMYLLLILIICVCNDLGGFIFGKILKGPRLSKISPNKTYSGMVGSFILPFLIIFLFSKIISTNYYLGFDINTIVFIITVSAISQLGDLVISYFKRLSNMKDTGNIIPGHGGILDRIDGMIFAFPFAYLTILITNIKIFS